MMFLSVLLTAIQLSGVTGQSLRARAFFDANNVKVGDPLVLTVDFLGEADFKELHPPALARAVNRRDWKLDDRSAKTDTFRDARRLTYRIRPMREGLLWFPALEFEYRGADGQPHTVKANAIPVHAKAGSQVVVAEMSETDERGLPKPPALVEAKGLAGDELFRWRKAMAKPSAAAFADFSFAEGRLNEASCAITEGNWAEAMKIYSLLEWRIGQTPEIERGIVAALALRYDNPDAELPVWRAVGRPLLKYAWPGRIGIAAGAVAALALVLWLLGRVIRLLAALALAAALVVPGEASARDLFEEMEEHMRQMQQQMNGFSHGFNVRFGAESREPIEIKASLSASKRVVTVGENFEFVIALEAPKTCSLSNLRFAPSERFGLTVAGELRTLEAGKSANVSNRVTRIAVPVRYDVPFKGKVAFSVSGMVTGRDQSQGRRGFFSSFTFSNSFQSDTESVAIEIRPLGNAPADYAGVVSEGLYLFEQAAPLRVETNDVVTIVYRMRPKGYVPAEFLPEGAAFEWTRDNATGEIEYRRFFVADGAEKTPKLSVAYYDPKQKRFLRAECGGTPLKYHIDKGR